MSNSKLPSKDSLPRHHFVKAKPNHWLEIMATQTPHEWDRAEQRLELLTDYQIVEAFNVLLVHSGEYETEITAAEPLREYARQILQKAKQRLDEETWFYMIGEPYGWCNRFVFRVGNDETGGLDMVPAPELDPEWHRELFILAMLGLLQVAGYKATGLNTPPMSGEQDVEPIDYWPAGGLAIRWTPEDAMVTLAEEKMNAEAEGESDD